MGLKDLVVSSDEMSEQQIEEIVSPFLRYDPEARELVLLPAFSDLTNRQKTVVYLVGMQGWRLVCPDDPPSSSASPAELSSALGIAGGSLRPVLKELRERHVVGKDDGAYSVRATAYARIRGILAPEQGPETEPKEASKNKTDTRKRTRSAKTTTPAGESTRSSNRSTTRGGQRRGRRDATLAGKGPLERVRDLIAEGWFQTPRTVKELLAELSDRGAHYKRTDLTRQMITLVRGQELRRSKDVPESGGRAVWHYSNW